MERIGFINGDLNAQIIKGLLESCNIKSSVSGWSFTGKGGQGGPCAIYVEREKVAEAQEILKEKGFLIETEK